MTGIPAARGRAAGAAAGARGIARVAPAARFNRISA